MGYLHIDNLYKNQDVLLFRAVYAMEKIHGTSAHISWDEANGGLKFFSGGAKGADFEALFNQDQLIKGILALQLPKIIIFGEAYGGKLQGMKETYGDKLRFVAFDVKIGDCWLSVPKAEAIAISLGLDFVYYRMVDATIDALNAERGLPSVQAVKNGIEKPMPREGIVIRPIIELRKNNDGRIIAKHKADQFSETHTVREVSQEKMKILEEARAIAEEWVTPMRLNHVLDKLPKPLDISQTGLVVKAMIEDIEREASGEIVPSQNAKKEIGKATALLFKSHLKTLAFGTNV